jgi:hypothetical protein
MEIQVLCAIFKLTHGANFLICNDLFAIGKSIVTLVLYEVVDVVNVTFTRLIYWPVGLKMRVIMEDFKQFCRFVWCVSLAARLCLN